MNRICKASILAVLLATVLLGSPVITLGAVIEVSQPVQVTSDMYYERGQAIVAFPWPLATAMRVAEGMPNALYRTVVTPRRSPRSKG